MRYLLLLSLFNSVLTPAAAQVTPAPKYIFATRVQVPGVNCAFFPAAAELPFYLYDPCGPFERFTPIPSQLVLVEKTFLPARIQQIASAASVDSISFDSDSKDFIYNNLKKYYRQYYGFYNCQHQPCLYINFFLDEDVATGNIYDIEPYWLREPVRMLFGGANYWTICFNVATQELYDFRYNRSGP